MHRVAFAVAVAALMLGSTEALAKFNEKSIFETTRSDGLSLTARTDVDGYAGYLIAEPTRFESAALMGRPAAARFQLAQAETAPPPAAGGEAAAPMAAQSREELERELADLQANPPGLVMPIVLTAVGLAVFYVGYFVYGLGLYAGAVGATASFGVVAIIGLVVMIAGIALGVVGAILLVKAILAKVKHSRRMREIENELQNQSAPPPAATTPSVRFEGDRLQPQWTLATF